MDKRFVLNEELKNPLCELDKEYSLPDVYSFGPIQNINIKSSTQSKNEMTIILNILNKN